MTTKQGSFIGLVMVITRLDFEVWNSFISGMRRPIDMEWKGCEPSIYDHDIDWCDHGGVGRCTG